MKSCRWMGHLKQCQSINASVTGPNRRLMKFAKASVFTVDGHDLIKRRRVESHVDNIRA